MDQICIIGESSTRKSQLLDLMVDYLRNTLRYKSKKLFLAKLQLGERFVYGVHLNNTVLFFRDEIDESPAWLTDLLRDQTFTIAFNQQYEQYCIGFQEEPELFDHLWLDNNGHDLICHLPVQFEKDQTWHLADVPLTKGHEAESLQQTFPLYNEISPDKVSDFWALLVFLFARRQEAWQQFQKNPEQKSLSSEQMMAQFDAQYSDVLTGLVHAWGPILESENLEIDPESLRLPLHIRERLHLQLRDKTTQKVVPFGDLDTGIRHLMFKLGHLWALGFQRQVRTSFRIWEEPESHLHPSQLEASLHGIMDATMPGQSIFTTNSPQFARQFEPISRILLRTNRNGIMESSKGQASKSANWEEFVSSDFKP